MDMQWAPLIGEYEVDGQTLTFKGGWVEELGRKVPALGNFVANRRFAGGCISAEVEFSQVDEFSACETILYHDPAAEFFVTAGLGAAGRLYNIRDFQRVWVTRATGGDRANLKAGRPYALEVRLSGSRVTLTADGVDVLSTVLPYQLQEGQVGIWCLSGSDIAVRNFRLAAEDPKAFVVMQFTPPYNELYEDVIGPICAEHGVKAVRADEVPGPGMVVADIVTQIIESKLVIAEISSVNPNVYYEIGYAHALGKPTILIAEKATKLPFDVSPFRVLFYENTIAGKKRVEQGLRRHLGPVLSPTRE